MDIYVVSKVYPVVMSSFAVNVDTDLRELELQFVIGKEENGYLGMEQCVNVSVCLKYTPLYHKTLVQLLLLCVRIFNLSMLLIHIKG